MMPSEIAVGRYRQIYISIATQKLVCHITKFINGYCNVSALQCGCYIKLVFLFKNCYQLSFVDKVGQIYPEIGKKLQLCTHNRRR